MEKKVLVPIAVGSEEIEAVCIIDVLRRAGAEVTVASVGEKSVICSRGIQIIADCLIDDCKDKSYDLIALPGGMPGAEHLRDSQTLVELLKKQKQDGKLYAAICASPVVVLQHHNLLKGLDATCHFSMKKQLENPKKLDQKIVIDKNCITSQGPGTALIFALELVKLLFGEKKANGLKKAMVVD